MSGIDISKIKKLFKEKKFPETILEIESSTTEQNRSSQLYNLLGVCRASKKGRTNKDVVNAFNDFEIAFNKDNLGEISLESLCNYIKLCAEMGRRESDLVNNMLIAEKMYLSAEKKFFNDIRFISHGIDLYKYLIKHEERILKVEKIIDLIGINELFGKLYISAHMYLNKWSQKDFKEFQKKFSDLFVVYKAKKLEKIDPKKKKIKVAFLSPDFHNNHSITYFIKNLVKDLKQTKFETHGLSLLKDNMHDENAKKLLSNFDNWIALGEKKDQEVVDIIQEMKIDILIDLGGLWATNRISIFNTRICPLQISWLGFNNSTGLKEVDFIIADQNTVKEEEQFYTSKIYKLPKIWNSHCGFKLKRSFNELPYKKNGFFTFGSLNNFRKVNEEILDVWIKILKKVKNSKLILKSSLYICEDVIKKKFQKEGLNERIEILKKTDARNFLSHINTYDKIDMCLDTFPYNGVTTTFEALWKNVPVLTRAGYNFNSRCGESILRNCNLENFIASNNDDYINLAVYYSSNPEKLDVIRKRIFEEIEESPLFNTKEFTNDFCRALEHMLTDINKNR